MVVLRRAYPQGVFMPFTFIAPYRVRYHDCDAYGHMRQANYLRYMQETAVEASAAVGYDLLRYNDLNQRWLIRETHIEFIQPLFFQDEFVVKTWVAGFRRIRTQRHYEFYRAETLVARAYTDWVLIDLRTRQPVAASQQMIAAYARGEPFPELAAHSRFPTPPPPPPGVFRERRRVLWEDIDTEQHVNNARYLDFVADTAFEVSAFLGWPLERLRREGFIIVMRDQHIAYKQPAVLGDELEIATYVYGLKRISGTRFFNITRLSDGALLAQVHSGLVAVHPQTGKPTRIPPHFISECAPNLVLG
ncbi:MAG: acyl-CoA thioesterase [Chloroflexi bacterium]|nr:acyl-CoA thioesterase [Chloroflexota bacterium]